jgi:MFS family permease
VIFSCLCSLSLVILFTAKMEPGEFKQPKWLILLFMCLCATASNYVYDLPGVLGTGSSHSLQAVWMDSGKNYTQSMNQGLYAAYSIPNIVTVVVGGLIIDKYLLLPLSTLLAALSFLLGSSVFYVGLCWTSYPMLAAGRVIVGFGCESIALAQTAWVSRWFKGKWGFALAYGLATAFQRVGSWLNFFFSPRIAGAVSLHFAVFMGIAAACVACLMGLATVVFDSCHHARGTVPPFKPGKGLNPTEVRNLPRAFWCLLCAVATLWSSLLGFVGVGQQYLAVKYHYPVEEASSLMSVYHFVIIAASPLIGFVVDRLGRNGYFIVLAGGTLTAAFALAAFTSAAFPAIPILFLLGLSFSIAASSVLPCFPLLVKAEQLGVGYALNRASTSALLSLVRLVAGAILDHYTAPNSALPGSHHPKPTLEGYRMLFLFLASLSVLSVGIAIFLCFLDRQDSPAPDIPAHALNEGEQATLLRPRGIINASASMRRFTLQR